MIFVSLGTQDKPFKRLLDYIENSNIDDEIIVQSGFTDYDSKKFKLVQYLNKDEFDNMIDKADYVICHAGVGTIITSISKGKKVLAVPRLYKYGEHQNDHQLQIADAYTKKGYILEMLENDDFNEKVKELKEFIPNKFVSNNKAFIEKLKNYIITKG